MTHFLHCYRCEKSFDLDKPPIANTLEEHAYACFVKSEAEKYFRSLGPPPRSSSCRLTQNDSGALVNIWVQAKDARQGAPFSIDFRFFQSHLFETAFDVTVNLDWVDGLRYTRSRYYGKAAPTSFHWHLYTMLKDAAPQSALDKMSYKGFFDFVTRGEKNG